MALRTLTVDFNSYFASCEMKERPELRWRPVRIVTTVDFLRSALPSNLSLDPHRQGQRRLGCSVSCGHVEPEENEPLA